MSGQKDKNQNFISIKGARVHNLKNVSLNIPKNKLTVITGLSGSGKSSLAFDTIYAEAERRLLDSFSGYARQFLNVKNKPEVEKISNLSPAIAIDQKNLAKNSRSTVGTITEIYDFLRVLFARLGKPHCPECGKLLKKQTTEEMFQAIDKERRQKAGRLLFIFAPLARAKRGEHKKTLEEIRKQGFLRTRIDGEIMRTEEALDLDLDYKKKHTLEAMVDRLILDKDAEKARLMESLGTALALGKGTAIVSFLPEADQPLAEAAAEFVSFKNAKEIIFNRNFACVDCGFSLSALEPRLFSFNSPQGACQKCGGLGTCLEVDPELVIPNKDLTLAEGAIHPWARFFSAGGKESWQELTLKDLAQKYKFSLNAPVKNLSKKAVELTLFGEAGPAGSFEGVAVDLKKRWRETDSERTRSELERYMRETLCSACGGKRLKPEARSIFLNLNDKEKYGLADISQMPI
ncbi:MAG: excinuclease ABC subunit UvrA, partial [Patescibacteria group bacterium]